MKGKFITFEGSEGSGKSTQAKLLAGFLKSKGKRVVFLREPGRTRIGEKIRKILLNKANTDICSTSEMLLYMAARAQLIDEVIKPALTVGVIVICDRFLDSTIVYQGYGLGMDVSLIKRLGAFVTQEIKPDLTILLDLPVVKGLAACRNNGVLDRIEQRSLAYHRRVRQGYLSLASEDPRRIKIVKLQKDKEKTQDKIRTIIKNRKFI